MDYSRRIFVIFLVTFFKFANSGLTRRAPEIQSGPIRSFYNNTPIFVRRNNLLVVPNVEDLSLREQNQRRENMRLSDYSEQRNTNEDVMVFPDSGHVSDNFFIPRRNHNREFSTESSLMQEDNTSDYPVEEIRKLIGENPLLKQYFSTPPVIGTRNKEHEEGLESLCEVKSRKSFYPRKLKNIHEEDVLVVNDEKEGYLQAVEFKECGSKNSHCKFDMFGYSSMCVQKYETRQLMVYANTTNKLLFDQFKVPSCCVCMIKKVNA